MNQEEAAESLQLIRRVVSQARDDSALQNRGLVWVLHAFTNGGGFLGTHWLFLQGLREPGPYAFLWGVIIPLNLLAIFWLQRRGTVGVCSCVTQLRGGLVRVRARLLRLAAGGPQARFV